MKRLSPRLLTARDEKAEHLRARFAGISRRAFRGAERWRIAWRWMPLIIGAGVAVSVYVGIRLLSPWPLLLTLQHLGSIGNCDAARAMGVAPARQGEPGYWPSHDADGDGVACEPWPR